MAPERLCLGCGLRVDEKFTPIFPGERGPLFAASVKLLQFALRVSSASAFAKELTEEEEALRQAIRPLVMNPDCHFLAVLTVLVQSILEGRTDCPISEVFGAGKTRAAAAMIAGLLVMDPTLKVMVVTKENAAAHAFAKHIESLQLPSSLEEKFGRLVGATELEKGPASQTKLDIVPGYRNTVLRTKQVIIGCGGGFHQECTQPYSPVACWMADVDVALNDEGQQYGNLDEASAFTNTEWMSGSGGAIISRSVTSCAGMTAFLVLLAQTIGWVSSVGGEGKASINSQHKNKLPKKKRPMRGLQLLSPERNRFASSWAHWTCKDWLEPRLSLVA